MHKQRPLLELSEAERIWIGGFAEALRQLSPPLAADNQGVVADALAREAFEDEGLRRLPAPAAAQHWWAHRPRPES